MVKIIDVGILGIILVLVSMLTLAGTNWLTAYIAKQKHMVRGFSITEIRMSILIVGISALIFGVIAIASALGYYITW